MPIALDNVFEAALLSNAHTLRISNEVLTFRRNSVFIQSSLRNLPSDERIVMPTHTVSSVCDHTCAARLNCNNHCTVNNIYQTHHFKLKNLFIICRKVCLGYITINYRKCQISVFSGAFISVFISLSVELFPVFLCSFEEI